MAITSAPTPLYDKHPVMFGDKPVTFIFLCILVPIVIGALALLAWYFGSLSNRLTITNNKMIHRRGILSKRVKEIAIENIRSIEVDQTFLQRLTNVGKIKVYTIGDIPEIVLSGLPRPYDIRTLIAEKKE